VWQLVHINIPKELYDAIDDYLVQDGFHISVPEFVREALREKVYKLRQHRMENIRLNIKINEQRRREEHAGSQNSKP
jgi:Arc/MetJ-type ribon-helix-helix transcriptional regulator